MTDLPTPAPSRGNSRYYGFALAAVVVCGALYFWANTGPAGGPGDRRARGLDPAVPAAPAASADAGE